MTTMSWQAREPSLEGEIALVTGAGTGIGEACAMELARRGAAVMVADVQASAVSRVVGAIAGSAAGLVLDVRDAVAVDEAVAMTVERFGGLTVAVNNAGVGVPVAYKVADISDEEWRRVLSVNLDGVFHCMRAELRAMHSGGVGGSIVNMGSISSLVGLAGAASYTSAKHAIFGLTKAAAAEYAAEGIRVNLVTPGYVDTAISPRTSEQKAALAAKHPMNRLGTVDDVAQVVCFLASRAAAFVTGSQYGVDGGYTAA